MFSRKSAVFLGFALLSLFAASGGQADDRLDLLDLANGAVVLSKSSEYGGTQWSALALVDGTPDLGWCSANDAPFPHEILIELAKPASLTSLVFDQTRNQEASGYPGISAKDVEVWASNVSPSAGFSKILQAQLPKGGRQEFPLSAQTSARWLKFTIRSNWGDAHYTELMELEAYGQFLPGAAAQAPLSGVFTSNYGPILFDQAGNSVKGCYYDGAATVNGTTDGRVVRFEWREQEGKRVGTAMMILSSAGDFINGFWYEKGLLAGSWYGERAKSGEKVNCSVDAKSGVIERDIAQTGRSITYGILFDTASDKIKPESEPTLNEVLNLLKSQTALNLGIEGHTDSQGNDAYNQDLSQRRAQSVVNWLTAKGIPAARLSAAGFGKTKPVSDNATAQGRALNRRVELVKK